MSIQLQIDPAQRRSLAAEAVALARPPELVQFLVIFAQFGLIVLLIQQFHLESRSLARVVKLSLAGFAVHHFLPLRWRLPWFVALSLAATVVVLGAVPGLTLIGVGLGLIGICHLPAAFWVRVSLVAAAGAGLAVLRTRSASFPALAGMWSILGSMFVFRMMIYLYDLKHRAAPFGLMRALAYFFMLPNACFPLFPIVDYKTFCASDHTPDRLRTYQTGLTWMLRGIVHLLLYRLVYQFGVIDIVDVRTAGDATRFMVATYLLYLHVSGQFHLIVGLLHMFGFNLPETHHLYLLASSFTDLWRRINIYWKDFIMKLFFNPAFFALRRVAPSRAMTVATLLAFVATWALHSWQYFWTTGSFLLTWQDVSFWAILAILVTINVSQEATRGRKRYLSKQRFDWGSTLRVALATAGTFAAMCVLWTLWSAQSWDELRLLGEAYRAGGPWDIAVILGGLAAVGVAGAILGGSARETSVGRTAASPFRLWRSALAFSIGAAFVSGLPALGGLARSPAVDSYVKALSDDGFNAKDADRQRRGFYEELEQARLVDELQRMSKKQPEGWTSAEGLYLDRDDYLMKTFAPHAKAVMGGQPVTINRWGMRDRDYEKNKAKGVYRCLMIGASHEAGWGVRDDQTFENVTEDRWNRERPVPGHSEIEVLNLSMGGLDVFQKLMQAERLGFEFSPDAAIIAVTSLDAKFIVEHLSRAVRADRLPPYPEVAALLEQAGVTRGDSELVVRSRLMPIRYRLIEAGLRKASEICRARRIECYVLYRPSAVTGADLDAATREEIARQTAALGIPLLDLSPAFDEVADRRSIVNATWDDHTNAQGHQLLAGEFYKELVSELLRGAARSRAADQGKPESLPDRVK